MILSGANLLLIDEPTNHLDIESCEAVEQMLSSYDGAMLLVSHDRFFIDQVADAIVTLEERRLNYYCGNYSYYQQKQQEQQTMPDRPDDKEISISPQAKERERQKGMQRTRRSLIKKIVESESLIQKLEDRKKELEILLFDPLVNRDLEKLYSLHEEHSRLEPLMEKAMLQWEHASQALLQLDVIEQ
jgi:ATP-binding cassette subfamily F protein 3